ncbi:molybdopterin oxidoreductase [Sphaerotilus natans subsp. natans DSM 6575]|uniref:Molybdopterin oxidoreductase n=1 Tax=Sphaerotilus natans subsp. natans DSM 6575 TaxID=1286631 RepID=A0A059KG21_9BURK|nr:nitrate reductase [Sphaerotilus natans]KDB50406.1 molybdopterin oxidoreductase [Sphaerotilus natans subsp. natans DSM 6575]SIQ41218.1 assimilatory nitrate reductase (NADH) alpha subunit apoprotein [Sphaerotilus natans]
MMQTRSTCPYCGVGCGVIIESDGTQITGVRGDPEHPANFGRLCTKGSTLHLTASAAITRSSRLLQPMQRLQRDAAPQPIDWTHALDTAADRIADVVRQHGPDAVGLYLSGQLLTEDYYVFNKLAKGLLGTNNVDTNSRLCMSSAVAGYKKTLGADAPPCSYEDVAHADTVFITGSNTAWAHPILFRRMEDARAARPGQRWIVVDVRRTETAETADLFLQIRPGTDVALYHGLLHVMLAEGLTDARYIAAHTTGFAALREVVQDWTPARAAEVCGIAEADLIQAARWFAQADRPGGATLSLYCMGLNQSAAGTDKNAALINLHLATGQIGRAGAGPFSLTGQPNAMGGREVGGLSNLLSAHRDLANPAHRAEVAALWGLPDVPATPGRSAIEMFEAAADGEIRLLWIACTNPAQSIPDQAMVRRALERAEFVIVQEAFATTATAAYADLLLPATTWGEKIGSVTNSERRISRVRPAVAAPGQARHDWQIAIDVARRIEARLPERLHGQATLFPYADAESIWNEHRESTRGRDLDITGLSWAHLEQHGPQQWPMPEGARAGRPRLYEDGVFPTEDGRARFAPVSFRPVAEPVDALYPFSLISGRLRDQWHGMSRTGTLGRLFGHVPEPGVEMNAADLAALGLKDGDLVEVRSRRGSVVLAAQAGGAVARGQVSIPMHWGEEVLGGTDADGTPRRGVNGLTLPTFCPGSKQPELKHAAVSVVKADLPWRMVGLAWLPQDEILRVREHLRALMPRFAHAMVLPFGREPHDGGLGGVIWRASAATPAEASLIAEIAALLGLDAPTAMRYEDAERGQFRSARLDGGRLRGVLLAGDTRAESWLRTLVKDELPAQAYGRRLLAASATPPVAIAERGRQVCTCFNVTEPQIVEQLGHCEGSAEARLQQLQGALKCGTNCGSCLPVLRGLVRASIPLVPVAG